LTPPLFRSYVVSLMPIIIRCFSASDGHPSVVKDWQQCLSNLIMAILDTYDTLRTSLIVPRSPLPFEKVLDNISQLKGTQFHTLLVDNFMSLTRQVHPEH
jgi:response regulator RpfG family c-di-GMP phosphodiesterase